MRFVTNEWVATFFMAPRGDLLTHHEVTRKITPHIGPGHFGPTQIGPDQIGPDPNWSQSKLAPSQIGSAPNWPHPKLALDPNWSHPQIGPNPKFTPSLNDIFIKTFKRTRKGSSTQIFSRPLGYIATEL